ncbi:hypothetical protein GCM10027290_34910 [Micromonospora sonneratiae]|uniref:PQQ-binding-like beta-propeller repeat protein n=1 Tax=Micromonospora sonneratiae TaxID=1184706 RepID=A0ABW3Y8I2_9ACTN
MGTPKGTGTLSGARNRRRSIIAAVAAVLAVVAAGAIAYRVLAPAEELTPARVAYPSPATRAPGVIGALPTAPLIVDDRIRVHASPRQVVADHPVDARTRRTPYWSYRRWPAQLTGVVAAHTTVVTRWSDGELVALDARTGRISWRASGPEPGQGYEGRRTGAVEVYAPSGLHTATTRDGQAVLVVTGRTELRGVDLVTGRELWRDAVAPSCRRDGLTTTTGQFVSVDVCASPQMAEFRNVADGTPVTRWRPEDAGSKLTVDGLDCGPGRSGCPALRTTSGESSRGWFPATGGPVAVPALDSPEVVLAGEWAIAPGPTELVARVADTGSPAWRRSDLGPVRILATQPGRVHLLSEAGDLINLDPATGTESSRFPFTQGRRGVTWVPGFAYAAGGFLAVERLATPVDPTADDDAYYLHMEPVIFAAS